MKWMLAGFAQQSSKSNEYLQIHQTLLRLGPLLSQKYFQLVERNDRVMRRGRSLGNRQKTLFATKVSQPVSPFTQSYRT